MSYQLEITELSGLPPADRILSERERAFYETLRLPKRRTEWLGGRFALKTLSARILGVDMTQLETLPQESGKPSLLVDGVPTALAFSITHSHGYAAAAASLNCRFIGIDLEKIENRIATWAEDFFHASERTSMDDAFLTVLWTKKEAVSKLLGTGLSLNSFDLRFVGEKLEFYGPALRVYQSIGSPEIVLESPSAPAGFALCVACAR